MPRRVLTFKTCSRVIKSIAPSSAIALLFLGSSVRADVAPPLPSLAQLASARRAALAALHVRSPKSFETSGELRASNVSGSFHSWQTDHRERFDEVLGIRRETTLRVDGRLYVRNSTGEVRELRGLLARRQKTEDAIASEQFLSDGQISTVAARVTIPGDRQTYVVRVAPPNAQPEDVYLDASSSMIDRVSFDDIDGTTTIDYDSYRTVGGALVPMREITSNGDREFDSMQLVTHVAVDKPIAPATFDVPAGVVIDAPAPVTVPLKIDRAHVFVRVGVRGHTYNFLLDSGAQGVVLDSSVARELGLNAFGRLQVTGAQRTGGLGMAALDSVRIGDATLPLGVVSVLDLRTSLPGLSDVDGILGYPLFGAAEIRIDPDAQRLTLARPGTLPPLGDALDVDTDRELVEVSAKVNGTPGSFIVDTGDGLELLLFKPFLDAHPGLLTYSTQSLATSYGVGGSARAVAAFVDELDLGGERLFNRRSNVMLVTRGAFADRFDAGNIGFATLQNFVQTYDIAHGKLYLRRAGTFDDGRFRVRNSAIFPTSFLTPRELRFAHDDERAASS